MSPAPSLTRVRGVSARVGPHDWAWARDAHAAIAANWQRRVAATPAMFNGAVLLAHEAEVAPDGTLRVALFESDYATLTALIDLGFPDRSVANIFAALAPRTKDGAYLLGRMGGHTARAGQAYFACGTPDRTDVEPDGRVDLAASARREFTEETGLVVGGGSEGFVVVRDGGLLGILEPVTLAQDTAAVLAGIDAHLAREAEPELDGMVLVRGPGDIDPATMPAYVRAFLAEALAGPAP
ncbi:MAG: NUDIX hydrolase [Methylobacterium frigidaeris]